MSPFSMAMLKRYKQGYHSIGLTLVLAAAIFHLLTPAGQAQSRSAVVQEGYSLLERGWVNDAINVFRQALQANPQSVEAQLGLAIAYQRAGQDEQAWIAYQRVLAQDPNNIAALEAIGELATYRPEWQQTGVEALTVLLTLQPANLTARSQRALLYGYQGRFVEAITDYEQVLSTNPASETLLNAAQIYTYSGDAETGLALFDQYLTRARTIPDSAISAYTLALRQTNQPDVAIEVLTNRLRSLSDSEPLAIELRSALAVAYQANQQTEEALASLEPLRNQAAATLPLARALIAIGRQTQDQTLYVEAIDQYQQALAQTANPSSGLLIEVADVLSETAATRSTALNLYQQVLTQQPDNLAVQVKMLWLSYQLGELSRSSFQTQLRPLIQPLPASRVEQQQLAQALVQINPPDPALLDVYQTLLPTNVSFLQFRIAQIELQRGNSAAARQALAAYRQTLRTPDPAAELLLAEIERQEGNLAASAQQYEEISVRYRNRPAGKDALRGLAGIRLAQGRATDALTIYEQLLSEYPNDLAIQLGRTAIAYQQQQISETEAIQALTAWQTTPSEFSPELFLLVGALPADPERADLYESLLEIEPNNVAINRRWVQLWALRDPDKARARVDQLVGENPNRVEAYFIQGELAQAIGDLELASQSYEAILTAQPNQLDALAALAGVRFQQQRYSEAETLYRQVLAQRPEDREIQRVLAELNAAQDQTVSALQQLRQLQQEQPAAQNSQIDQRLRQLQIDFLRRRGFQPRWERY